VGAAASPHGLDWSLGRGDRRSPQPPAADWPRAFSRWLKTKAPNTQRAYQRAWDDLLAFTHKHPAHLLTADLQAWVDDLGTRSLDPAVLNGLQRKGSRGDETARGLSPATIAQWISAVSSFYRYVTQQHLIPTADGGERPLHSHNPARALTRPQPAAYHQATYLDAGQLRRLLNAIPRHTVAGRRDYALLLGYILTGRRNSEWRTLRWGDLRARGTTIYYTWQGKHTAQARHELPPPVWDALRDYLQAAGRLDRMRPGDYLFTPLTDNAARLPNIDPSTWDRRRPISANTANGLLKTYARRAGLDPHRLHIHTLRHSAAMLEEELGAGLTRISKLLGHRSPKTTLHYLDHLRGQPDTTWQQKAHLLHLEEPLPRGRDPREAN
jgi:integrase